jgi:hypothetical protein
LYGHVLRINEERITKKVLNITIKGKKSNRKTEIKMGKEVRKALMWKEKYGRILSKSSFRKLDVFGGA